MNSRRNRSLLSDWEEVSCPICEGKGEIDVIWPDPTRGNINRCKLCTIAYRSPRKVEQEQTRHFSEEWTEARPIFSLEDYRNKLLLQIRNWILQSYPGPGSILDVGCSIGKFLGQFPDSWHRVGIEPSFWASQVAKERLLKAHIIQGTLDTVYLPPRSFQIITLIDTIYYFSNPLRDLSRLSQFLKPGGRLIIEAQNFTNRGMIYRLTRHAFDDTWMYFYSPRSLEKILNAVGLRVVDRMDLPGHRLGSPFFLARFITMAEFMILKSFKRISPNTLDLVPHFVLAAEKAI